MIRELEIRELERKKEKGQQFLVFIKVSFQGYWPIFIRRIAKKHLTELLFSVIVYLEVSG